MIVTDHHWWVDIPDATAVINPKRPDCKYPEDMLAGVGVTFKLVEALLTIAKAQDRRELPVAEDFLDLVAIGTVADLVPPQNHENRALVIRGLEKLKQTNRLGLQALMEVASITPAQVSAYAIGFMIAPRINAAGRLDSAMTAYELLTTTDRFVASEYAQKLQTLNVTRQQLTREMQELARIQAGMETAANTPLIFASNPDFKQGIVGLVAGRLTEEYYRPSIVVQQGPEESHGSCRSIEEFNITEALDQVADLLIRHGGHAQAAGFTIHNENLPLFRERMMEIAGDELTGKDLRPRLEIDAEVPLHKLDMRLYDALSSMEPCGHGYPAPILCARKLRVADCRTVGKDNAHLKLKLTDGALEQDAIAFRFGEYIRDLPMTVDVAYQLEINEWQGERRLQMNVVDIRPYDYEARRN
ncbi:MAG: DHHA1 domain-containing protein [Anaerolineae bacterium]